VIDTRVKRFLIPDCFSLSQMTLHPESNDAIEVANVVSLMYAQDPRLPWPAFVRGQQAARKAMTARPNDRSDALSNRLQKILATNIKRERERLGLSQRDLAAKMSTGQRRITLLELAGANPTILTLARLSTHLHVSVVDLLTPQSRSPKS
jgi:ribosome-binding protein aMBF1 (putative translation factor)